MSLFVFAKLTLPYRRQRRKHYLKTKKEPIYTALLLSGKLESQLSKVCRPYP